MTRPTPETLAHRIHATPATVAAPVARPAAAGPAGAARPRRAAQGDRRRVARPVARGARRRGRVRHPGRRDPAGVRPALRLEGAAHPGPPRAGRGARRHRVRAGHRQGRRLHRHLRPGRDQPGHPDRRRLHGLGARSWRSPGRCRARRSARDAFQEADIQGITLPITKHNYLVQTRRGDPADPGRGVPPGRHRPARPGAGRHPQGRAPGADHVQLAAHAGPARLPADPAPARQADPRGGPADRHGAAARCCTSAAACSRPAPPRGCASSPS